MNWYVAEAVFESVVEAAAPDYLPLVERSWFLISAPDEEMAQAKAVALATARQESYSNVAGETVRWPLRRIERVREVMDRVLGDGTEVWSVIFRPGEHAEMDTGQR